MKKITSVIALFFIVWNLSGVRAATLNTDTLRFATYNVRVDVDAGHRDWANRKQHVADIIKNLYEFDIFGVQELKSSAQEDGLMEYLSDTYTSFSKGIGNTAGTSGTRNAIIFKTARLEKLRSGFFFLSPTPDVVSIGWDAKLKRICLWVKMRDKFTSKEFYFFCAHYDHVGDEARRQSSKLVLSKIKEIMGNEELPVLFVGDLNRQPDTYPINILLNGGLLDSRSLPDKANIFGPIGTTNGWDKDPSVLTNRIDFILVNNKVEIHSYYTIAKMYYSDAYPSDHFPVMVKAMLNDQPSGLQPIIVSSGVKVTMPENDQLLLKSDIPFTYAIYDITGKLINTQPKCQHTDVLIPLKGRGKGICLVKTHSATGNSTAKIYTH